MAPTLRPRVSLRGLSPDPLAAAARSAYIQAGYLVTVGTLAFFKPHVAHALFDAITFSAPLTPIGSETLWFRVFGAFGMGYVGFWYAMAAASRNETAFWASVVTRGLVLPAFHIALVASGATSTAWLEAASAGAHA